MLNSQRERHARHQADLAFSRRLLRLHVALGWVPALLLFLHGLMFQSSAAMVWWLCSLAMVPVIKGGRDVARVILGWFCLLGAAGFGWLMLGSASLQTPESAPRLGRDWLPVWASLGMVLYLVLGLIFLMNARLKKAVTRGFYRW